MQDKSIHVSPYDDGICRITSRVFCFPVGDPESYTPNNMKGQRSPDIGFINRSNEYCSSAGYGPFHTHIMVREVLFVSLFGGV